VVVSIDFETRSPVDLWTEGAYRYALHPGTGIYTLSYAFGDEEPQTWLPGQPLPERLVQHVEQGGTLLAWNAQFERLIWWYVLTPDHGFPEPALEQFRCTAARARAHGMPGALGDAARAMGLADGKDPEGKRLIKTYSANNVPWDQIPEQDRASWVEYCERDVVTERAIGQCLRELDWQEWHEYWACERLNDRGVPVDLAMAAAALEYATEVRDDVDRKIRDLTGGQVKSSNSRTDRDAWLLPQLTEPQIRLLETYKNGVKKISFDQSHREALALHPELTEPVARWLELMGEAGGATISKYKGMAAREIDGRVNGAILWNGAGQTGRFASRGLQLHNLRRDSFDEPGPYIADLLAGYQLPDVTDTLARLVRSAIHDPNGMTWCDWSAIEGRVAPWLANSTDGEAKLDLFREGKGRLRRHRGRDLRDPGRGSHQRPAPGREGPGAVAAVPGRCRGTEGHGPQLRPAHRGRMGRDPPRPVAGRKPVGQGLREGPRARHLPRDPQAGAVVRGRPRGLRLRRRRLALVQAPVRQAAGLLPAPDRAGGYALGR
jgi:DNA polymerase bacteriophage-type